MNASFWKKKRVFVTGHTGFKGSWMCLWLQSLGAEVVGYALPPPTNPNLFNIANVASGMFSIMGDIRDFEKLRKEILESGAEVVFHMAAQSLVTASYDDPLETYSTNVMGTVHILEAVRQSPSVRACIVVTSDKCYENLEWVWGYRENDRMGGYDPYSNSKGCAELVVSAYRSSYFNPKDFGRHKMALASARAGNVIGGGDWATNRLVPDILRAFENKKPVTIRNPQSIRPWQHVLEPVGGYMLLAQKLLERGSEMAEAWNFGPDDGDSKSVQWIVEKMISMWREKSSYRVENTNPLHEAHYLKLDCSKALISLGWTPKWGLTRALEEVVSWHQDYLSGQEMRERTLMQIQRYQELLSIA